METSGEPTAARPTTPLVVTGAAGCLFVLMVGGALAAAALVVHARPRAQHAASIASAAPPSPRAATQQPPSACAGCGDPGTACIDGVCRLAPSARWLVRPFAISRLPGPDLAYALCIRHLETDPWTCSPVRPGMPAGSRVLQYCPDAASGIVMSSHDLSYGNFFAQVTLGNRAVALGAGPKTGLVAVHKLFAGGLELGVQGASAVRDVFVKITLE